MNFGDFGKFIHSLRDYLQNTNKFEKLEYLNVVLKYTEPVIILFNGKDKIERCNHQNNCSNEYKKCIGYALKYLVSDLKRFEKTLLYKKIKNKTFDSDLKLFYQAKQNKYEIMNFDKQKFFRCQDESITIWDCFNELVTINVQYFNNYVQKCLK